MISVKPIIMLSGVRSSWLTLATNSALAWRASSAMCWRALSRSDSRASSRFALSRSSRARVSSRRCSRASSRWRLACSKPDSDHSVTVSSGSTTARPSSPVNAPAIGMASARAWGRGALNIAEVAHQATASTTNSLTSAPAQPTVTIATRGSSANVKATCGWSNRNIASASAAARPPCQTSCASA